MNSLSKWDNYFLNVCREIGKNSKCHSRQIGSILVKDKIIISTGYNGPPRGVLPCSKRWMKDGNLERAAELRNISWSDIKKDIDNERCPRQTLGFKSGEGLEWCVAVHSEKNCLISASRMGVSTLGATLYIDAEISPCNQCLGAAINAGIKEIVVVKNNIYDPSVKWLMESSGIYIREFYK